MQRDSCLNCALYQRKLLLRAWDFPKNENRAFRLKAGTLCFSGVGTHRICLLLCKEILIVSRRLSVTVKPNRAQTHMRQQQRNVAKGFATVVLWGVRMTSAELKHRAELQEWAAQIQECRSSGLSVSEWCRQQGVTTTLLASFSGIPLSFAEAQILPSKKTVKMLRSGLKK